MEHRPQPRVLWAALAILAIAASRVTFGTQLRPFVVLAFLVFCPGMALVRLLRVGPGLVQLPVAVALSLTLDTLVSGAMLYAHAWSPKGSLAVLVVLTVVVVVADTVQTARGRVRAQSAR